jgi:hypothetical protein
VIIKSKRGICRDKKGASKEYGGEDTRKTKSKETPESVETKSKKRREEK